MEGIFFRAGIFLVVLWYAFRMWCVMLLISVSISCVGDVWVYVYFVAEF